jgi:hypothetical protein
MQLLRVLGVLLGLILVDAGFDHRTANASQGCGNPYTDSHCDSCTDVHTFAAECDWTGESTEFNFQPPSPYCACDCADCSNEDANPIGTCFCD